MSLRELTERIRKLHLLLSDPQPGLLTWNEALAREMAELIEKWQKG